MVGPGEFKIGSSVPMATRIGVKAPVNKTIKGPAGGFASEIASIQIADQFFATTLGLMQKCIGIQWEGIVAVQFDPGAD